MSSVSEQRRVCDGESWVRVCSCEDVTSDGIGRMGPLCSLKQYACAMCVCVW